MAKVTATQTNYFVEPLYQYDLNQVLEIHGLSFATTPEIHFAHAGMDYAIVRKTTVDAEGVIRVQIPNSLLQKAQRINAYICTYEGEAFQTVYKLVIPVKPRNCPADYELPDEYELYSFDTMEAEAITLEPGAEATVEKLLRDDKVVIRFGIPVTADVYGDVAEATRAAAAARESEQNAGNSASAAQSAQRAAETARDAAKNFAESLPTATAEDNGKFLRVVNGVWAAEELTNVAEEGA